MADSDGTSRGDCRNARPRENESSCHESLIIALIQLPYAYTERLLPSKFRQGGISGLAVLGGEPSAH